ncbi:glycosyltransferase family 2 protein [Pararhodobacter zhoushanensis]|uniref:glycosyltransferase family 2 protein n=1 Tax=Pararhodobacter zhoushanensis TaxID=2479545 RepID=UPI0013DF3787|nr:glycosyltransferase family 2 protein [Pararhodobacter zhoushanensis]
MQLADITVVSVTYNSGHVLPGMLASVPAETPVVVVDNASPEGAPIPTAERDIRVIRSAVNHGFGWGCNAGAAVARTPYLLFLNPDARLTPDCLTRLLEARQAYPAASAFNPRIEDETGAVFFRRATRLRGNKGRIRVKPTRDMEVPVLSGAALFVSKAHFDAVGGFDENIFLYAEDDDLSVRLQDAIGPLMLIFDAVVTHEAGTSTEPSPATTAFKQFHLTRAMVYTMHKHGRPLAFAQCLLQALRQFLKPRTYRSEAVKAATQAYLKGVWSARRDHGRYNPKG